MAEAETTTPEAGTEEAAAAAEKAAADAVAAEEAGKAEDKGGAGKTIAAERRDAPADAKPNGKDKPADAGADAGKGTKAAQTEPAGWPDDWRRQIAGDDAKALKTLERFTDPRALFSTYEELRAWRDSGNILKKPGKDATEQEIAAFRKAMGVPDKPEGYIEKLDLGEGVELGEADKPLMEAFAKTAHEAGAPQEYVNATTRWFLQNQADQADAVDKADNEFKRDSEKTLGDEWKGDMDRNVQIGQLVFRDAPGGMDPEAEGGLYARLMGGRTADGKIIGNDPDVLRWLAGMGRELHPAATVTGSADAGATGLGERIKEIESWMNAQDQDTRVKYWKDEDVQKEYRELIDARLKMKDRA